MKVEETWEQVQPLDESFDNGVTAIIAHKNGGINLILGDP